MRQLRLQRGPEPLQVWLLPRRLDHRRHFFAGFGVVYSNNDDVLRAGQPLDSYLDLRGEDVETRGDDEVLGAVHEVEESIVVANNVPGAEPSIEKGGLVFFWSVQIARKNLRALDQKLAGLAVLNITRGILLIGKADVRIRERQAEATGAALGRKRGTAQSWRSLGHAVALDDVGAGALLPSLGDLRGKRHTARNRVTNRGDVCVIFDRLLADAIEHGRNAKEEGDVAAPVSLKGQLGAEGWQDDLTRADCHTATQQEGHTKRMEVWQQGEETLRAAVQFEYPEEILIDIHANIPVCERDGLGDAVGAGGMKNHGGITSGDRGVRALVGGGGGDRLVPRTSATRNRSPHLPAGCARLGNRHTQRRTHLRRQWVRDIHREDVLWGNPCLGERARCLFPRHALRAAVALNLLRHLGSGCQRVNLRNDCSQAHGAVKGDEVLGAVGHDERYDVALLDAGVR